jgi:hypothetical protein
VFFGIVCKNNLWEFLGTPLPLIILYLIIEQYTLLQHVDSMSQRHDARVTWVIMETWVVYCPKSGADMTINPPYVILNDYKHFEQ